MKQKALVILAALMMLFFYAFETYAGPEIAQADCSALSASERDFSSRLNFSNQEMFCNKMNEAQRRASMAISGRTDSYGVLMTPDGAVEKIAIDSNLNVNKKSGNCGNLTGSEQQFASGLTPSNRDIYCNKMNQIQRNRAMQIVGQPGPNGNMMTPDAAVDRVARDENLIGSRIRVQSADCSNLNPQEMEFANHLNSANRGLFCNRMNPAQRSRTMQMTTQPDSYGNTLSPDQAVEQVARENQLMIQRRGGGACPAR